MIDTLHTLGLTDWSSFAWGFGAMFLLVALFCGFILPTIVNAPTDKELDEEYLA